MISPTNPGVKIPFFGFLGGVFKSPFTGGSIPIAIAGRESVRRLINKIARLNY